jgi:hypothetical protein
MCSAVKIHLPPVPNVVDPKLFLSDPDPIFVRTLDPDPLFLVKSYRYGSSFGSYLCHSLFHNFNNKKAFSWYFKQVCGS